MDTHTDTCGMIFVKHPLVSNAPFTPGKCTATMHLALMPFAGVRVSIVKLNFFNGSFEAALVVKLRVAAHEPNKYAAL